MRYFFSVLFLFCLICAFSGCATVNRLDKQTRETITSTADSAGISTNMAEDAFYERPLQTETPEALLMTLDTALSLGSRFSRSLQARRDELYLAGVSVLAERRKFGPQYSGTLNYIISRASGQDAENSGNGMLRAGTILPTGGDLNVRAGINASNPGGGTNTFYTSQTGIDLRQPLLAGAGYEASHSSLIQAEQNLLYAVRSFTLERQDFTIGILRDYYELLRKKAVVLNTEKNAEQAEFLRKRSEALFKIRKATAMDVMRSQQQELSAINRLELARSSFDIAVKRFLIELGIPTDTETTIVGDIPELTPVGMQMEDCINTALAMRLDLQTEKDRVDDARRNLRTARNAMLPELSITGSATLRGEAEDSFPSEDTETELSAGAELALPLDKRNERDAVTRALIALKRSQRNLEQKHDEIEVQIIESFRLLKAQEQTVNIERKNSEIARRRADYAVLEFKSGNFSNRDVVEAQNQLLDAENSYVDALAAYETRRVLLLREIGALDVTPDGLLVELPVHNRTLPDNNQNHPEKQ